MKPETPYLRTGEALRASGLSSDIWEDAIRRGLFAADPKSASGQYRRFGRDDLIGLSIFRELLAVGLQRSHAAGIASDIRVVLRGSPDLDSITVVRGEDQRGNPIPVVVITPPSGALVLFSLSIGAMREAASVALEAAE